MYGLGLANHHPLLILASPVFLAYAVAAGERRLPEPAPLPDPRRRAPRRRPLRLDGLAFAAAGADQLPGPHRLVERAPHLHRSPDLLDTSTRTSTPASPTSFAMPGTSRRRRCGSSASWAASPPCGARFASYRSGWRLGLAVRSAGLRGQQLPAHCLARLQLRTPQDFHLSPVSPGCLRHPRPLVGPGRARAGATRARAAQADASRCLRRVRARGGGLVRPERHGQLPAARRIRGGTGAGVTRRDQGGRRLRTLFGPLRRTNLLSSLGGRTAPGPPVAGVSRRVLQRSRRGTLVHS